MAEMAEWASEVRVLCFDVFGTVVDYRPALVTGLARYGSSHDCAADWPVVADEWRASERVAMDRVNATSQWRDLDRLRTDCLLDVFARHGLPEPTEGERRELLASWSHGRAWNDVQPALARLRQRYVLTTLSNSTLATLVALSRNAGLDWDCVLSVELAHAFKPAPVTYRSTVGWLAEDAGQVLMVAAHPYDLVAAAEQGLRTAYVPRPQEAGENGRAEAPPPGVDLVAADLAELASALGCEETPVRPAGQSRP